VINEVTSSPGFFPQISERADEVRRCYPVKIFFSDERYGSQFVMFSSGIVDIQAIWSSS
jgi:hypothetical protein